MLTIQDYNYRTSISKLEGKIKIAAEGIDGIARAAERLGEKYNIPDDDLSPFINGLWDLKDHLGQKA